MTSVITGLIDGLAGSAVILTIATVFLCLGTAGIPGYFFDDILEMPEHIAYLLAAIVWIVGNRLVSSELDETVRHTMAELVGLSVARPVTYGTGILVVVYLLAAIGSWVERTGTERAA